jgi:hypothetical protein
MAHYGSSELVTLPPRGRWLWERYLLSMCRSIKRLRGPEGPATSEEIREAALQYVRKVSGFREPSRRNAEAFEAAVEEVASSSRRLLEAVSPLPAGREANEIETA